MFTVWALLLIFGYPVIILIAKISGYIAHKMDVKKEKERLERIKKEREEMRLEVEKQAAEEIAEKTAKYYEEIERLEFQKELYNRLYDVQGLDLHKNLDEQQLKKAIANEKAIASIDKRISALYDKIERLEG